MQSSKTMRAELRTEEQNQERSREDRIHRRSFVPRSVYEKHNKTPNIYIYLRSTQIDEISFYLSLPNPKLEIELLLSVIDERGPIWRER